MSLPATSTPNTDNDLTASRPLSADDHFWVHVRGPAGTGDNLAMIAIDCSSSTPVTDDDVVLAWAVLRLRHPILTSRISFADTTPRIVCTTVSTKARLLERTRIHVEFGVFADRELATQTLRSQWEGPQPERRIDINEEMHVIWLKDSNGSGQYLFGMQIAHYQLDARRRFEVMRQFVELLSAPWKAQAELDAHLAASLESLPTVPPSLADMFPQLDLSGIDVSEQQRGKDVFDELTERLRSTPRCGLSQDTTGDPSAVDTQSIRHTFPEETTSQIMRACKARDITVTQFLQAVNVVATIGTEIPSACPSSNPHGLPLHNDTCNFSMFLLIDLQSSEITVHSEVLALKLAWYNSFVSVPRAVAYSQDHIGAVWNVANQARDNYAALKKSPLFWQIIARYNQLVYSAPRALPRTIPFLPHISCYGIVSRYLPPHISAPVQSSEHGSCDPHPKELHIVDHMIATRVKVAMWHASTFHDRLTMQLTYNNAALPTATAERFFGLAINIMTQIASEPLS